MIAITPRRFEKIWGTELWVSSPLRPYQTLNVRGVLTTSGPLIKIIKTRAPLSVQVHPDDCLAVRLAGPDARGKDESWLVLAAAPDASVVLGLTTYDAARIRDALQRRRFAELLINERVAPGDFINIPAGLVHGLGANITVLEVQSPSSITYRYYDYDRRENNLPRELHIDAALQAQKALSWKLSPVRKSPRTYTTKAGRISIYHAPSLIKGPAIAVDLTTYQAYQVSDELVNLPYYALVTWT